MPGLLVAATILLVAWGAFAFGAVYPWAWQPLVAGCALVGVASLVATRRERLRLGTRGLLAALGLVLAGAALQTVPLPREVRTAVSPASEAFLLEQDLRYALAVRGAGAPAGDTSDLGSLPSTAPGDVPARPLSIDPAATSRGLALLAGLTLFLAGLVRLFSLTGVRTAVVWLIGIGTVLALVGILQKAMLGDHAWAGMKIYGFWSPRYRLTTPFGPFVNKNHFAGWMLLGLPLALGFALGLAERGLRHVRPRLRDRLLWLASPDGGRLQLALLALAIMALALALTLSRSGIGGFAVALVIAAVVASRTFPGRGRLLAGVGLVAVLGVTVAWANVDVTRGLGGRQASLALRKNIWSDTLSVLGDFPVTGTGLNTFGTAMLRYQTTQRDQHFQEAHNDYLQIAAEGGLLLGLPAAAAMALIAAGIRRRFAERRDDRMTYWLRVGAATGLAAMAVQSLVEFSLQMPGNAAFFVVLVAIALHRPVSREPAA